MRSDRDAGVSVLPQRRCGGRSEVCHVANSGTLFEEALRQQTLITSGRPLLADRLRSKDDSALANCLFRVVHDYVPNK